MRGRGVSGEGCSVKGEKRSVAREVKHGGHERRNRKKPNSWEITKSSTFHQADGDAQLMV